MYVTKSRKRYVSCDCVMSKTEHYQSASDEDDLVSSNGAPVVIIRILLILEAAIHACVAVYSLLCGNECLEAK